MWTNLEWGGGGGTISQHGSSRPLNTHVSTDIKVRTHVTAMRGESWLICRNTTRALLIQDSRRCYSNTIVDFKHMLFCWYDITSRLLLVLPRLKIQVWINHCKLRYRWLYALITQGEKKECLFCQGRKLAKLWANVCMPNIDKVSKVIYVYCLRFEIWNMCSIILYFSLFFSWCRILYGRG